MALNGFLDFFQKGKTFRPKKRFTAGTIRYSLHKQAQASLQSGINLRQVVRLPEGENLNDWIAVHVVDFFNRINLIYGTVSEYCNETTCPTMCGGSRYEYLWADGERILQNRILYIIILRRTTLSSVHYIFTDQWETQQSFKKPTALPAPKYIELLMDWIESQINNESIFPVSTDVPFPKSFPNLCRKILTRLFRVFVHVYIHHFDRIVSIGAEAHVNSCYKHFYYFVKEFDLITNKELEPLNEMTSRICKD